MKAAGIIAIAIAGIIALIVLGFGVHACGLVTGTAHKAMDVTAQQFDPATMLKRYEWFKDASAQLDKKLADVRVYERRLAALKQAYEGKPRSAWSREDREQSNLWLNEVAGIQASYNGLAAEYNAAMAKINYRFTNVGDLPAGAGTPLPREFKSYQLGE